MSKIGRELADGLKLPVMNEMDEIVSLRSASGAMYVLESSPTLCPKDWSGPRDARGRDASGRELTVCRSITQWEGSHGEMVWFEVTLVGGELFRVYDIIEAGIRGQPERCLE